MIRLNVNIVKYLIPVSLCLYLSVSQATGQVPGKIPGPAFRGTPPDNAFNGLVLLPGGELRHYGFEGNWFNPSAYIYTSSIDEGRHWTRHVLSDPDLFVNENMPPAAQSPWSGAYIRVIGKPGGTWVYRSREGIDGPYVKKQIDTTGGEMFRQPLFLNHSKRILVTCGRNILQNGHEVMQSWVYYSDDDGLTWKTSSVPVGPVFIPEWPHRKSRWQNYAIEPAITELSDGRLWMLLRTSMDELYQSYSEDHGTTWSKPGPSRFPATLTMPSFLRLRDNRLLLFFCNTVPLAEEDRSADTTIRAEQKNGLWEDVFTNRDAIHAAISDDDGLSWCGFRELYLNPLRNENDFATRGGKEVSLDKSVHQSQALELPDGNVIVALGQHPLVRAMLVFSPDWLYERERSSDFSNGLEDWSVFKYIRGIKGHCAYNRTTAPLLTVKSDGVPVKVLNIRHVFDSSLVCDVDGAVWNFPAACKGSLTISIWLNRGCRGGEIMLSDRWINPTDTITSRSAVYTLCFTGGAGIGELTRLPVEKWLKLTFRWDDLQSGTCSVYVDNQRTSMQLPLLNKSINGISYLRFQPVTDEEDVNGYLVKSVHAEKKD